MTSAEVKLWGTKIGAVAWDNKRDIANFEYDPHFIKSGIEVSPITMPLSSGIYSFPALNKEAFHGLPGLLADSLPDKFGNALIDTWLAGQGRTPESFNAVERLCYVGSRGMGALEFAPMVGPKPQKSRKIDIDALVGLASEILTKRHEFTQSFSTSKRENALQDILRIGTSAGGARAKAVIALNPTTNEVRSGQIDPGEGFSHWILKFDGVGGNVDKDLDESQGYGLIEYAYHKMAVEAGIEMTECQLLKENGRSHFMTKRFDRTKEGKKIHMQSLGAIAHYDFNMIGAYSYEQAIQVIRRLGLPMSAVEQQFRRMTFNIMARNQDDHVKNIAFLMDKKGAWKLSPAFDVMYSYNVSGPWTSKHQMSMNGKQDHFEKEDFMRFAKTVSIKTATAEAILSEIQTVVSKWPKIAEDVGIPQGTIRKIGSTHREIVV